MSIKKVQITDIADFDSVDVVEILVKAGDEVSVDQSLVTVESEKAMMDFPSPYQGVIEKVTVKEGGQVQEGDTLVTIKVSSDDSDDSSQEKEPESAESNGDKPTQSEKDESSKDEKDKSKQQINESHNKENDKKSASEQDDGVDKDEDDKNLSEAESSDVETSSKEDSSKEDSGKESADKDSNKENKKQSVSLSSETSSTYASPGVQKYARELGVNLDEIEGSGRQQRILQADVQQYVYQYVNSGSAVSQDRDLDFSAFGEANAEDMTKIQKITAQNMLHAWQSIPHVTHFDQADVTELEKHRKQLAKELAEKDIKLTPLAFVIKALVACLKKFPQFNASLDSTKQQIIYKKYFHIGIAVDTPHGLLLPVLRNANEKTIQEIAKELMELGDLARERRLKPKQMAGASMTISSLGNLGGQAFTPIINPPEVAILGLSTMIINETMTIDGSEVSKQKLLPLSLSYDHRVINGADAARFCTHLKNVLEDVWKLIL